MAKWIIHEHSTIGGNVLQLVEMGAGRGILMNNIINVSIYSIIQIKNNLKFLKVLRQQKYSHTHTFLAIYENNPLMRRRQAETLLGRSV